MLVVRVLFEACIVFSSTDAVLGPRVSGGDVGRVATLVRLLAHLLTRGSLSDFVKRA